MSFGYLVGEVNDCAATAPMPETTLLDNSILGVFLSLCGLPNPWFATKCLHENDGNPKMTKMTKTTQTALSAGSAEITETTEITKTMGIWVQTTGSPNSRFIKTQPWGSGEKLTRSNLRGVLKQDFYEHNLFLELLEHHRDTPAKMPGYPAEGFSRDIPPTPSRGRPPPHRKISGPKTEV